MYWSTKLCFHCGQFDTIKMIGITIPNNTHCLNIIYNYYFHKEYITLLEFLNICYVPWTKVDLMLFCFSVYLKFICFVDSLTNLRPQAVMATAQVLFHRFYCKKSFVRFSAKVISLSSVPVVEQFLFFNLFWV